MGWDKRPKELSDQSAPPLSRRKKDRQYANSEYIRKRKKFLEDHPLCQVCEIRGCTKVEKATHIHHRKSRKTHLNDESVFVAVCRSCEHWIHSVMPEFCKWIGLWQPGRR